MKKYLIIALGIGFLLLGFNAYQQAKPAPKAPIYKEIKKFSPYYIDKRFGGLQIMSRIDPEFKEKPNNIEVFHRLEFLEKEWGKKHLKIKDNSLNILDNNSSVVKTIPLSNRDNISFLHNFYGI
jgi:hypothetical protein